MYVKKIYILAWAINFALVGMVGYVWGNYTGLQAHKTVDNQMAIRYALIQAMNEGQ